MDALTIWTIYSNPIDYPGLFVARQFAFKDHKPYPTDIILTHKTLAGIRLMLPVGLCRFDRSPSDPVSIIENWL